MWFGDVRLIDMTRAFASISAGGQSVEPYGIMVRRDDAAFKKVVDAAMVNTYKSGAINAIYQKWFQKPVPPKNVNLNLPMSDSFSRTSEVRSYIATMSLIDAPALRSGGRVVGCPALSSLSLSRVPFSGTPQSSCRRAWPRGSA